MSVGRFLMRHRIIYFESTLCKHSSISIPIMCRETAHRETSVVSRMTRCDLLMCPFEVERRREMRAYVRKRVCTRRSTEPQCVSEFLRGVTRREENGGFQKVERTRPTNHPFVRPTVRPSRRLNDTIERSACIDAA